MQVKHWGIFHPTFAIDLLLDTCSTGGCLIYQNEHCSLVWTLSTVIIKLSLMHTDVKLQCVMESFVKMVKYVKLEWVRQFNMAKVEEI